MPEETCFQQAGSSDERKVLASLSLFLKSEKIPALLYIGKGSEYRPFPDFQPAPSAYRSGHRSQISEGPVLRPVSYMKISGRILDLLCCVSFLKLRNLKQKVPPTDEVEILLRVRCPPYSVQNF
jgi:hypothetical protein